MRYIFEDGSAVADFMWEQAHLPAGTFIPAISEYNGMKRGDVVIDARHRIGTIEHVFRDGRATVSFLWGSEVINAGSYVPETTQHDGWAKGHEIFNRTGQRGIVQHVFRDGRIVADFGWGGRQTLNPGGFSRQPAVNRNACRFGYGELP